MTEEANSRETIISIRSIIPVADAGLVIGKGGQNVQEIRTATNTKIRVSEFIRGSRERVISVSGTPAEVSEAYAMIVRKIVEDKEHDPLSPNIYAITFLTPHQLMGAIIGKNGSKIREIQVNSGARLVASDSLLLNSTERTVTVSGKVDQICLAIEEYTTVIGGVCSGGVRLSGNVPYEPTPGVSVLRLPGGHNHTSSRRISSGEVYHGSSSASMGISRSISSPPKHQLAPGESLSSQTVNVPSELVGAIIGRGGARVKEFRKTSGAQIRIADAHNGSSERQVTITGSNQAIETALRLIYTCMDTERIRIAEDAQKQQQQQSVEYD